MSLARATEVSVRRAIERREIREYVEVNGSGRERLAELIEAGDERALPIRLGRLLRMAPRIGDHRARRLLAAAGMHPGRETRRLGELTANERRRLAGELRR